MLHQVYQRLKANSLYLIISFAIFAKGLAFYFDHRFFFFPPSLAWFMNNAYLDFSMIFAGLALFAYVCTSYSNNRLLGIILAVITVLIAIIASIEIEHVVFAGKIELIQDAISNVIIICFTLWTARHYSKR